jgi:putative ABC transport system permease protein
MIARLFATLRGLLARRRIEDEIDEELRDHLEREIEAHRSRGLSAEEARRLALRDLGGLTQTIESTRAVRATWLDTVWRDVAYAARVLRRSPRFTTTALTLLVLGIGSTTAIISIAYTVLVRPLPYANADRLVFLAESREGRSMAWLNYTDWRRRATSFEGMASSVADGVIRRGGQFPQQLDSRNVTANFFSVLGTTPSQGRLFHESDARPDAAPTAVVSHAFAIREFGSAQATVGQTLSMNGRSYTVIGVLPPGFRFMTVAHVYLLLEPQAAANYRGMQNRRDHTSLHAVGRLKPGVSLTAARAEMQNIAAALVLEYPDTNSGRDNAACCVYIVPLADRIVGDMAPTLTVVAGAVVLLLLIACVNLAGLLLNRSASRAGEFAVRAAIGGSRWDLIRQLLIEQALLVLIGGVLGAVAGAAILTALVSLAPREMPRLDEIHLDLIVLSWTTLLSCGCAFLFGIVPAIKASGVSGQELVVRSGRGSTRSTPALRQALMLAEIVVATVLLSGAGLMVHTMIRLTRVDPGFDPRNLQTVMFLLSGPQWPDAKRPVFYDAVVERLGALPGVENAALSTSLPILGSNWWTVFSIQGTTAEHWISTGEFPNADTVLVTASYFDTLRIPLVKGRYFDQTDTPNSAPVAIVSSNVAGKFWPNEDPLGKQIRQGFPTEPFGPWRTIVGIVGDVRQQGVDRETTPQLFMPVVQVPRATVFTIVRTRETVSPSSLEAAIHDVDRNVSVFNDRTVDQLMRDSSSRRRIAMIVLSAFGFVAVLLAAIGVYGVIAQAVAERRQEIGVRMALGATGGQIRGLFLRHGLIVVTVGIACGVVMALAAARSLASLVFGVTVTDPATLSAVAALLTVVTLVACYMPARSATRVDPLEALRSE